MTAPVPGPDSPGSEREWLGKLDEPTAAEADLAITAGAIGSVPKLKQDARALLVSLVRPHKKMLWVIAAGVLVLNLATLAGPWLVGLAIDDGLPDALHGDYATIGWITAGLVLSALIAGVFNRWFLLQAGRVGQAMLFDLRRRLFDHVQALSVSWHEKFTSGRVISRLTSDVDTLNELLEAALDGLVTASLNIVTITVILLILDWQLALVAIASFIPLALLYRWFATRSSVVFRRTREAIASLIVQFVETMNGIRAVQVFRRERRNEQIFDDLNVDYRAANAQAFRLHAVFIPGVTLIGNVATVVVLVVGGMRVAGGGLEIGVLTAFLLYLTQFYGPMQDVAIFVNSLQSATAAMEKISAVMAEKPSVPEAVDPDPLPEDAAGAVTLQDVEFGYVDGRPVLPGLELSIPAGQTVALVGETGAGKTTIAKLISRMYDPRSGTVALDGVDLRRLAETDLRRAVVMVTQDGFLFSGSVADNIAFGRPDADRAEVEAAARAVGAHEFIAALPGGYDTDVAKRGGRLSAGQRQLVAFARAFLADPAVLILDEATSSLDVPTERAVQRALRTVLHDRTAVIIAHRLSTVEIADRVLVLDRGRIVEDGAPSDLVDTGEGRFAELYESWRASLV